MKELALFFVLLTTARNAFAYIDPGTGSIILQALVAAFLAALFTIKSYWNSIRAFLRGRFAGKSEKHVDPSK